MKNRERVPGIRGVERLSLFLVGAVLLLPPLVYWPTLQEPFRLLKLLLSEILGLVSLLVLALRLPRLEQCDLRTVWRLPAVRCTLPFLLVASLGLFTSAHPDMVREAMWSLWVGAACWIGWSLLGRRLRPLLDLLLVAGTVLGAVALLQFHDIVQPIQFAGGEEGQRVGVTSFAGSVGDLAAYLLLPCLLAQAAVWRLAQRRGTTGGGGWRLGVSRWVAVWTAFVVVHYAMLITQTLAALAALAVASTLLWALLLPPRRRLASLAVAVVLAGSVLVVAEPIRRRASYAADRLREGRLEEALSGRTDGWSAALWMLQQRPVLGVGHGAYVAEFAPAKLALLDDGWQPYAGHRFSSMFGNAHNEYLEVAAELGLPGLLALLWGMVVVVHSCAKRSLAATTAEQTAAAALGWAGVASLAVVALAYFPFRIGLTAYPAIALLAWVTRPHSGEGRT